MRLVQEPRKFGGWLLEGRLIRSTVLTTPDEQWDNVLGAQRASEIIVLKIKSLTGVITTIIKDEYTLSQS